ncbi:MAG TPA: glycosyltransferase, partial [Chloroflexota bacterium]|nr:glycosyltransferase [Chloroflexota bacterium]
RDRQPKAALACVSRAFAGVPFSASLFWPRISVVVCTHNGESTLRDCLEGVTKLEYPSYEVIIVDDGSTDATPAIAREYDVHLISTDNCGLSCARNTGIRAATGDIVAFIDDDAYPDPHWLTYLANTFQNTAHVGVGGPNLPPPGRGLIPECVANAPGGPIHVLLSDTEAEHIPGCNMAFRKASLEAIGGFDTQFRVAGDDVDLCWRLQQKGWTLGFNPGAVVWHHRRDSVRAYWKQQKGYGEAEAMLERKWPEKYNALGHIAWTGRLYGNGLAQLLASRRGRIYQGTWGSALFQSLYQPAPTLLGSLALMPEWYLVIAVLAVFSLLGFLWTPLLLAVALLVLAISAPLVSAAVNMAGALVTLQSRSLLVRLKVSVVIALLFLLQPAARLLGRLRYGLTPWRRYGANAASSSRLPIFWSRLRVFTIWNERWQAPEAWLGALESALKARNLVIIRGGDFDSWDLEVRSGTLGAVRTRLVVEEHGAGKQLFRFRFWSRWSPAWVTAILGTTALAMGAALDDAWLACGIFGGTAMFLAARTLRRRAIAMSAVYDVLNTLKMETESGSSRSEALTDLHSLVLPQEVGTDKRPSAMQPVEMGKREVGPPRGALLAGLSSLERRNSSGRTGTTSDEVLG